MRILGIDPGYGLVGWGIVDFSKSGDPTVVDYGVIETDKVRELPERLNEIYEDMKVLFKKFNPDLVGMETLVFYKNITTGMAVAEARGVIALAVERDGLKVLPVAPTQVKTAVSGYGKATKNQMQENVKLLCRLDEIPRPDDAADAIAVALASYDLNAAAGITNSL